MGLNAFLAASPSITELAIPQVGDWPPRSSSVRRISIIDSCCMVDLPSRATLPSLTHLSVHFINHDLGHSEVQLAATLQALAGIQFECDCFSLVCCHGLSSCAGFLHVLSSKAFVVAGARDLQCNDINFAPHMLERLAVCFPALGSMCLNKCSFIPSELCAFPQLSVCFIYPMEDDLQDGEPFERFSQSILQCCSAAQARRPADLPILRLCLDDWEGLQVQGLVGVQEAWKRKLAESGEAARVSLIYRCPQAGYWPTIA